MPKANQIRVMTFSPTERALCTGTTIVEDESKHQFTLTYDMKTRATGRKTGNGG